MQPYVDVMIRADVAERRGDALGALEALDRRPFGPDGKMFWRRERVTRLVQLTQLGPLLPPWVHSRWILAQALQQWGGATNSRMMRALEVAVAIRGGEDALPGIDRADARAKVVDGDWVFRQLALYELGGLDAFLRAAPADLMSGADRIAEWAAAPMSGFRLVSRTPSTVMWEDLATGERRCVDNIGSAALAMLGECVVGRLVPVSTRSSWMFESAPLVVAEPVARTVAAAPADWLAAVTAGLQGEDVPMSQSAFEFAMVTDVPRVVWLHALLEGRPADLASQPVTLVRALLDRVCAALEGPSSRDEQLGVELWPCVYAAVLDPFVMSGFDEALENGDLPTMVALAERLPDPAAAVCEDLRNRFIARGGQDCA